MVTSEHAFGDTYCKWYDSWDMSVFDNVDRFKRVKALADGIVVRILDKNSDRWMSKSKNGFNIDDDNDEVNMSFELKATDNPYIWKLKDMSTGNYLESIFGTLRLTVENAKVSQQWRLELEEDGCYKIQNVNDKKLLSISGASSFAGSNLFLVEEGASNSQSFGLYFDTKAYDYEMADMFSLSYWQENKRLMTEQQKYEEGGTGISRMENDDENNVVLYPMSNNGDFKVFINNNSTADIQIVEIGSGRVVYSDKLVKRGEAVVIHLAGILLPGIYTVRIQTPESVVVKRMVVSHML